jgi:hypothetical protein
MSGKVLHVSFQRGYSEGALCYRWMRLSNLQFAPPLSQPPLSYPTFGGPGIAAHSMAAASGPAGFTWLEDGRQRVTLFADSVSPPFLVDMADDAYPVSIFSSLSAIAVAALGGLREAVWCAAGVRWQGGSSAIRATTFAQRTGTAIARTAASVYDLKPGEWAKHVLVYSDPAQGKRLFVLWELLETASQTGNVLLSRSLDGGGTFS